MFKRKLKFINHIITVVPLTGKDAKLSDAECDYSNNLIKLDPEIPKTRKESALVHEITHWLCYESGASEILKNKEEGFVTRFETSLYYFLRKNTRFFRGK